MNAANPETIRQARGARTRTIRRRVITGAVAVFVAAWVWIAVVLISGKDPALASHVSTTAQVSSGSGTSGAAKPVTSSSGSTGSTAASGSTGTSGSTGATGSTGSTGTVGSSPSSVTTQQS